jgi:transposase
MVCRILTIRRRRTDISANGSAQITTQPVEKPKNPPNVIKVGRGFCQGEGSVVMIGTKRRNFAPHINVSLEELVPHDHFYRDLDQKLDLLFVRTFVQRTYADGGRPSIDPIVFFKLQLVMFFEGIRSERQLMRQAADRLSVRWYLGYDLGEALPDHSSLSRIRTRYGLDVFRRFFDAILEQCQQAKLIWGKELYIDATRVDANASLDSLTTRFAVEAREAIQKHLRELFQSENEQQTAEPDSPATQSSPPPIALPTSLSEEEQETLSTQQITRHDWYAKGGEQQREVRGLYQRRSDQRVSTTDPDATPMRHGGGPLHLGYQTHYVVDGGKQRMILAALVTPAEVMENQPMLDLLWHARFRWRLRPRQVTGDTKYGTLENIKAIEDAGMRAYIPLFNRDNEHGAYYGSSRFTYDAVHDVYLCPAGQPLHLSRMEYKAEKAEYQADAATCNACPLKAQCTPSPSGRQVHRSFHADYLERVKGYYQTEAYQKALRKRKVWVEPLFAEAKDWHGMRRFRLRRLWRVNGEALVTASGQNLKRLLRKRGWGRRPFPAEAVAMTPPPYWEPDESPRHDLLKSYRPSIAVAPFVARGVLKAFFELQVSRFSLVIISSLYFSYSIVLHFKISSYLFIAILLFIPFLEKLGAATFICSTGTFSTGCDRFSD